MIARAAVVEAADVPLASLPACAECDGGRVSASGASSTWRSGVPLGVEVSGGCARGTQLAARVALVGAFGPKAGRSAGRDDSIHAVETVRVGGDDNHTPKPSSKASSEARSRTEVESEAEESWSVTEEVDHAAAEHDVWLDSDFALAEEPDLADALASNGVDPTSQRACNSGASVATVAVALVVALELSPKSGSYGWLMLLSALTAALVTAPGSVPNAVIAF